MQANPQTMFYISTGSSQARARVGINIAANPANGFSVAGRRDTADGATTITSSLTANQWRVVTSIFDYANQDLILRIDGTQVAINTSFGSGGVSENTDSLLRVLGYSGIVSSVPVNPARFYLAGLTIWNHTVGLSEIQASENLSVSYTHLTLPTKPMMCRCGWSPYN